MTRQKKKFEIIGSEPGAFKMNYILHPIGYSYNRDVLEAKKGDTISFSDGNSYKVFAVRRIRLTSALADILAQMRYGVTIKKMLQIWQQDAMMLGHGRSVVSLDECIFITYNKEEDYEYV